MTNQVLSDWPLTSGLTQEVSSTVLLGGRAGPCSDLRTSMSTLQHSTLSVLNRYAELQMLVLFLMQTLWCT